MVKINLYVLLEKIHAQLILLNLLNSNKDNFTLEFNFQDSGMARLIKLKDNILEKPKKIIRRKNLIKIILNKLRG